RQGSLSRDRKQPLNDDCGIDTAGETGIRDDGQWLADQGGKAEICGQTRQSWASHVVFANHGPERSPDRILAGTFRPDQGEDLLLSHVRGQAIAKPVLESIDALSVVTPDRIEELQPFCRLG